MYTYSHTRCKQAKRGARSGDADGDSLSSGTEVAGTDDADGDMLSSGTDDSDGDDIEQAAAAPPRERVHEVWGIFKIAPVRAVRSVDGTRMKFQIGWGATCGRCRNAGEAETVICKLQRSGTCDRTKRLVAWWCLRGVNCKGPSARTDHLRMCPGPAEEPPSWEELVESRRRLFGA